MRRKIHKGNPKEQFISFKMQLIWFIRHQLIKRIKKLKKRIKIFLKIQENIDPKTYIKITRIKKFYMKELSRKGKLLILFICIIFNFKKGG